MAELSEDAKGSVFKAIQDAIHLDMMEETGLAIELLTPHCLESPEEPAFRIYLAWYLGSEGHFDLAIEHARQGVQLLPRSSRASLVLFHTLWNAGERAEGIEEIKRFLPLRRSEKHTPHYADILKKWEAGDRTTEVARRPSRISRLTRQ